VDDQARPKMRLIATVLLTAMTEPLFSTPARRPDLACGVDIRDPDRCYDQILK
jgi:hypothetical protein